MTDHVIAATTTTTATTAPTVAAPAPSAATATVIAAPTQLMSHLSDDIIAVGPDCLLSHDQTRMIFRRIFAAYHPIQDLTMLMEAAELYVSLNSHPKEPLSEEDLAFVQIRLGCLAMTLYFEACGEGKQTDDQDNLACLCYAVLLMPN